MFYVSTMGSRQKQRTKGNVQPSSSGRTAELMAREGGSAVGFIGFGATFGDLGYVPSSQEDHDSALDGDFKIVLRKLTKKDVVTKLKALQEFGALCKDKDQETVTATLPHWSRLYGRLAIDHDKRVREATQQAFLQLVERVQRNLAPHLRSLMGPWLLAQCDTFPAARMTARRAFGSAFPTNKQRDAVCYCSKQVLQYLHGNLFKETPATLSDANTMTAEEQEEKYVQVITSSLHALGELISVATAADMAGCDQIAAVLEEGKLWKMAKHKSPMIRAALYSLLGSVCEQLPVLAEKHLARISPTLLGNLDEVESSTVTALWESVLVLISQFSECWSHINPRKAVLPKLWSFLRKGGQGCAFLIFPNLLPLLSKIPDVVIGNGAGFYQEFFNHFKTGLCSDGVCRLLSESEAVVRAYMECLRYVITKNLTTTDASNEIQIWLIESYLLPLLESSITEDNCRLSSTSLYSQTATLTSYLQKHVANQATSDQATSRQMANDILTTIWKSITDLCFAQIQIDPVNVSELALDRISTLLSTFVCPAKAEVEISKMKAVKIRFDLVEGSEDIRKQEGNISIDDLNESPDSAKKAVRFATGDKDELRNSKLSTSHYPISISDDLSRLVCHLVNSCLMSAFQSQPHLQFLSKMLATFPTAEVFSEILYANSCRESKTNALPSGQKSRRIFENIYTAASECFHTVMLPWVINLERDDILDEKRDMDINYVLNMVEVVLRCAPYEHKMAVLDEICCQTSTPIVLHKLITKIVNQSDCAFLSLWLKSDKFGDKVIALADSLCHMTVTSQSVIKKQSWDLISLGLSTDDHGEPKMSPLYAERVLLKFTEALQAYKVRGQQEQTHNTASFICDIASHFFSGVQGCMLIKSTEMLLFTLFQIGCSDSATLSETVQEKINSAWNTGVEALVKQTGGFLGDEGFLHKVACWIKETLLTGTYTLLRCHNLAEAAYLLCMTVQSSLQSHAEDISCTHTMSELLSLMLPTEQEWDLHNTQLPTKWKVTLLLDGTLTYPNMQSPTDSNLCEMPTGVVLATFVSSLLHPRDPEHEEQLPWQFSVMKLAILEMAHTLQWCKGMMGLIATSRVDVCPPPVSHVPSYCQPVAVSLEMTLDRVLHTLGQEEWQSVIGKALDRSLSIGGLWATSLGGLLACYSDFISTSVVPKCNIYAMMGGADRLADMSQTSLHTLECVFPYLTIDHVLEVLQINTAVLITSDTLSIPNINGGLGVLAVLTHCLQHPLWDGVTQVYDGLIISCVEQVMAWRDDWEHGFLFNCNLAEADAELVPANIKVIRFLQQVVVRIPSSLSRNHWDFILCSLVSWIQSCTENVEVLNTDPHIATLCCTVCDLLTSTANLLNNPSHVHSKLPSNLATEWKEFFSEAAFTALLPFLVELTEYSSLSITHHHLLQSICEAISHTPEEHLHDNRLPVKLYPGSCLPDTLQTLTGTLCPMLSKPLRCVQLAAYEMLKRVMPSVTKHDERHLQDTSKDEQQVILTPPPALKDILDSSAVLMETLVGDVPIGECVTMDHGSEDYHDTLMYLLGWRLYLTIFKAASPEVRASYAVHMRETKLVDHLLENLFCLMPHVPTLASESGRQATSRLSAKTKLPQVTMFTQDSQLTIKDGTPSSLEIHHQAYAVYLSSLEELPAMVRNWWNSQDKRVATLVEKFTSKYVSPVLCTRELHGVQCQPTAFDNMTVRARPRTREVIATYAVKELSMDLVIQLAPNHPLGAIAVDSERKVGVSHSQWRNWMLQLTTFLTHQNGSILDGLKLWKRNVDKRFEGVDECMVCFSVIHASNYSLPKLTCKTCKKKFHSACLYKWFSTSNQSSCPLCRSPF